MPSIFCYVQAKTFHDELQDVLGRLTELDGQLITAQPVGGLPETAKDQLAKFMVNICIHIIIYDVFICLHTFINDCRVVNISGCFKYSSSDFLLIQEIQRELDVFEPRVTALLISGEALIRKSPDDAGQSLQKALNNLQTRWKNIRARSADRCNKLEDALKQAEGFHDSLNRFIAWLTQTEKTLNTLKKVSYVLDNVKEQIEDHKVS